MKRSTPKSNIFLIHAHADREAVHKLFHRMKKEELNVWLDSERLIPGQDWRNEIRNALLKCDAVIVCLSRAFDQKQGYRHEELKLAIEKASLLPDDEVFLIPARLEECEVPESLRRLHRVDLFRAGGYKKLMDVFRIRG
jgi:hypothetical protein